MDSDEGDRVGLDIQILRYEERRHKKQAIPAGGLAFSGQLTWCEKYMILQP